MANLKGSDFQKQIRDARIRTDKRGQKKADIQCKNFARSHVIVHARESQLHDFAKFLQNKGISEGKLNQYLTNQNLENFLKERTQNLASNSAETYIRGFNSLIKGLKNANISIQAEHNQITDNLVKPLKTEQKNIQIQTGRYISKQDFQQNIKKLPLRMKPIAHLQYRYGFRASEALEIVRNPAKYIQSNKIVNVQGKGGRIYKPKTISSAIKKDLQKPIKISKSSYQKAINRAFNNRSNHDLRLSYAKNKVDQLTKEGNSLLSSLRVVAEELNHSRLEITKYYLARA